MLYVNVRLMFSHYNVLSQCKFRVSVVFPSIFIHFCITIYFGLISFSAILLPLLFPIEEYGNRNGKEFFPPVSVCLFSSLDIWTLMSRPPARLMWRSCHERDCCPCQGRTRAKTYPPPRSIGHLEWPLGRFWETRQSHTCIKCNGEELRPCLVPNFFEIPITSKRILLFYSIR